MPKRRRRNRSFDIAPSLADRAMRDIKIAQQLFGRRSNGRPNSPFKPSPRSLRVIRS